MTGTTSISGLVSGLDTASIISQLMTIEAQPQTDLKSRLSDHQTQVTALQALNSKIAALAAQASDLNNATTWRPLKATSSSTAVAATATTGTAAGSFDITVVATAVAHQLTFSSTAKPGDHVTGGTNDVTLTVGGTTKTISSDGTLTGLVNALNAAGTGVKASTISLDDGSKRLDRAGRRAPAPPVRSRSPTPAAATCSAAPPCVRAPTPRSPSAPTPCTPRPTPSPGSSRGST